MRVIETCPKCGHDLVESVLAVLPPIDKKDCPKCGWSWTGRHEENVVRVPFHAGGIVDVEGLCRLN